MAMSTKIVDQLRGDILVDAMKKLHADPRRLPEAYYAATVVPDVGMLVEPVNGDPYVFLVPNTVHTFESRPGSGTDHLRQRMEASIFFRGVIAKKEAEKSRSGRPTVIESPRVTAARPRREARAA